MANDRRRDLLLRELGDLVGGLRRFVAALLRHRLRHHLGHHAVADHLGLAGRDHDALQRETGLGLLGGVDDLLQVRRQGGAGAHPLERTHDLRIDRQIGDPDVFGLVGGDRHVHAHPRTHRHGVAGPPAEVPGRPAEDRATVLLEELLDDRVRHLAGFGVRIASHHLRHRAHHRAEVEAGVGLLLRVHQQHRVGVRLDQHVAARPHDRIARGENLHPGAAGVDRGAHRHVLELGGFAFAANLLREDDSGNGRDRQAESEHEAEQDTERRAGLQS